MEVCSLEEDDVGDIFLTQSSRNLVPLVPNFGGESDRGGLEVESTPNAVLCRPIYSDSSDQEDFDIPCSQVQGGLGGSR